MIVVDACKECSNVGGTHGHMGAAFNSAAALLLLTDSPASTHSVQTPFGIQTLVWCLAATEQAQLIMLQPLLGFYLGAEYMCKLPIPQPVQPTAISKARIG